MKRKSNILTLQTEQEDTLSLIEKIKKDNWFTTSTTIVNCIPEYSSRLCQSLNHALSSVNKNELLEEIDLAIPYPNCNQVWNPSTKSYENFETYLKGWVNDNIYPINYLFVCCMMGDGKSLNKVRLSLRSKIENEYFRFASLYTQSDSIVIPDYYISSFDKKERPLFHWENPLNKNFE